MPYSFQGLGVEGLRYLAAASAEQLALATQLATQIMALLEENTKLTRLTQQLTKRIEGLTVEVHGRIVPGGV